MISRSEEREFDAVDQTIILYSRIVTKLRHQLKERNQEIEYMAEQEFGPNAAKEVREIHDKEEKE